MTAPMRMLGAVAGYLFGKAQKMEQLGSAQGNGQDKKTREIFVGAIRRIIMKTIGINAYDLAQRFNGMNELPGTLDNPQILAMLRLDTNVPEHDEVAWCSAFVNYIAWLLRLPRSKSLMARSWLT